MSPRVRRALAGLAGAAVMISVVTVASRILGFARTWVSLDALGATPVGDTYNTANMLPNVLFEVAAGGALAGALIPVIAGPLARGMRKDVDRIASAMLGWTLAILVPLALALALLAQPIAGIVVESAGAQRDLFASFVVVFAVQVPMYGIGVVLAGVLQAQRKFLWPACAPMLSSVVVIATYVVFGQWVANAGADVGTSDLGSLPGGALALLAWGTTAGVAAMSVPLIVPVWRSGVRVRPTLRFSPGTGRRVAHLALAGIGALVAQQVAVLVTIKLAWQFAPGGTYSTYLVVQAVYVLPYAVLAVPLATSTFPRLAARASTGDHVGYARMVSESTRAVLVASAVGAGALVAVAPAVAGVVVAYGTGDPALLAAVGPALTWIAPGLLGMGLIFHVSRSLYALERGRAAVVATSLGWFVVAVASVVACLVLVPTVKDGPATLTALAIGSTVGMLVAGVALIVALRRAAGPGATAGLPRTLVVLVVAGACGAVAGRWTVDSVRSLVDDGLAGSLFAAAGGAFLAAAIVLLAIWWADRTTITDLMSSDKGPRPMVRAAVPHEDSHG